MVKFSVSKEQWNSFEIWKEEHDKSCKFYDDGSKIDSPTGAIGGRFSYCFTPTGLGEVLIINCMCGKSINLTDYDSW